jgi:pimeloyl-ACP methyl ester carboxylesterase
MVEAPLSRLDVGGLSIAYRRRGQGPALVLLHGFLCDSRCWRPQLAGLAGFDIIAWDAPGAGASADVPESFTLEDWSGCLAGLLAALGIASANVLGVSWGGVLAQAFHHHHPERVSRLLLAGTYAGWLGSVGPAAAAQRLARCEADSHLPGKELARRWVDEMFTPAAPPALVAELAAIFAGFHPAGFRLMARSLATTDTTRWLANVDAPTLLLWGDDDRRSPLAIAERMRDAIPGARLERIAGAGHLANMEQPASFDRLVRDFCAGAPP